MAVIDKGERGMSAAISLIMLGEAAVVAAIAYRLGGLSWAAGTLAVLILMFLFCFALCEAAHMGDYMMEGCGWEERHDR